MIVVDPVVLVARRGRSIRTANLLSDQNGFSGTKELVGFGMKIGLKAGWMRNGAAEEHYELWGKMIDVAVDAGAVKVDRYRIARIVAEKQLHRKRRTT